MESTRRQFWRRLSEEFQTTGLSYRELASKHNVNPKTLEWWVRQFRKERNEESRSAQSAFVEVTPLVSVSSVQAPLTAAPSHRCHISAVQTERTETGRAPESMHLSGIELLVAGHQLRLSTGFDSATLSRVLDVLEARR
jgi:transposase-like protein